MSAPTIGTRKRFAPPKGATLDSSHSLAQGLEFLFAPALGMIDLAKGYPGTVNGSPSYATNSFGRSGRVAASTSDYYEFAGVPDALGPLTLAWVGRNLTASALRNMISKCEAAGGGVGPFDIYLGSGASPQELTVFRPNGTTWKSWYRASTIATNTDYVLLMTFADNNVATAPVVWVNNTRYVFTSTQGTATGTVAGSNQPIRIGRRPDGATQADAVVSMVAMWSRVITDDEARSIYADPFCFLKV